VNEERLAGIAAERDRRLAHLSCGSFFAVFEDEDEPFPLNFAAPRNEDEGAGSKQR